MVPCCLTTTNYQERAQRAESPIRVTNLPQRDDRESWGDWEECCMWRGEGTQTLPGHCSETICNDPEAETIDRTSDPC